MAAGSGIFGWGGGFSASTIGGNAGGAVSDLFASSALRTKGKGSRIEAEEYGLAQNLSLQNAQFTETSTAVKEAQAQRQINMTLGQQQADVAASGFVTGQGTALDLLRDSASQGALHQAVLGQQGAIDVAGYKEQAASYGLMKEASNMAATADDHAALGAEYSAAIKGVTAIASLA